MNKFPLRLGVGSLGVGSLGAFLRSGGQGGVFVDYRNIILVIKQKILIWV